MKTRYIIFSIFAVLFLTVSCEKEGAHFFEGLRVSQSYITLPAEGGSTTFEVTSDTEWTLNVLVQTDSLLANGSEAKNDTTGKNIPIYKDQLALYDWITVSPTTGGAGKTVVTVSAQESVLVNKATLYLESNGLTQNLIVTQGTDVVEDSTVKEINEGPDSKTYRVKGTCTQIVNTNYGNWYLTDDAGDKLYIYGTVDGTGKYNWSSFNIALGDVVTVEGPKTTYYGTPELVDVTVVKVEKAYLSAVKEEVVITKDGEPFQVKIVSKGESLKFESKADWLVMDNGYAVKGDTLSFTVTPEANATGKRRSGTLAFSGTKSKSNDVDIIVTVIQLSDTATGSVAELLAAAGSRADFDLTVDNLLVTYQNGSYTFLEDGKQGIAIYNNALKFNPGQTISGRIFGSASSYNNAPQITSLWTTLGKVTAAPTDSKKLPQPIEVTLDELLSNWDTYFLRLVRITGVSVTDELGATYNGGDRSGVVSDGTNEIAVYAQVKKWIQMESDKKYDVTCIPTVNKDLKQLGIWDPSHVKEAK